jgi:uncharacterized SAM-binding protein YcdF (DUF218 family)
MVLLLLGLLFVSLILVSVRWRRTGWLLALLAFALFFAAGCGPLPAWLLFHLQAPYATRPSIAWASRNVIVVLGAGTSRVPATHEVQPLIFADGRILEAYALYRACKQSGNDCKIVVSGGDAYRYGVAEADAYASVLVSIGMDRADLVLEARSMNTWQNAQFVQPLLKAYQPQQSVLVTSALHLRRAQLFFTHFGMSVIPVRGDYADVRLSWMPNSWNLALTDFALHEYIGVLTYRLYNAMGWNAPPSRNGAA